MVDILVVLSIPVAVSVLVLFGHIVYELWEHYRAERKN